MKIGRDECCVLECDSILWMVKEHGRISDEEGGVAQADFRRSM